MTKHPVNMYSAHKVHIWAGMRKILKIRQKSAVRAALLKFGRNVLLHERHRPVNLVDPTQNLGSYRPYPKYHRKTSKIGFENFFLHFFETDQVPGTIFRNLRDTFPPKPSIAQ